jgi:hypothetical protein
MLCHMFCCNHYHAGVECSWLGEDLNVKKNYNVQQTPSDDKHGFCGDELEKTSATKILMVTKHARFSTIIDNIVTIYSMIIDNIVTIYSMIIDNIVTIYSMIIVFPKQI